MTFYHNGLHFRLGQLCKRYFTWFIFLNGHQQGQEVGIAY
jgi:hypothetical protein